MNILICNERFLFRFGVDRVLLVLAKGLAERDHTVTLMGTRFDRDVVRHIAVRIIEAPTGDSDYLNLNEATHDWLKRSWHEHFTGASEPDIVLVGGWPFFMSIPFFRQMGAQVVFMDCGAVPLDGYTGGALITQQKVRSMRKRFLPEASQIISISSFIAGSQSLEDSGGTVPVATVLLGADHLETPLWAGEHLGSRQSADRGIQLLQALQRQGKKAILSLGRWEPGCYKNSDAVLGIMERIGKKIPDAAMLILADPKTTSVPGAFNNRIFPIGFPDDRELTEIMKTVDLGLSVSLWEGFNLPVAEMQWLDRPALCFPVGAHREVVAHPWYLCRDDEEMADKACEILQGRGLDRVTRDQAIAKFREQFTWGRFVDGYAGIFDTLIAGNASSGANTGKQLSIFIDVTNAAIDPANSGVIRVTRRLSRELQGMGDIMFVVWDQRINGYVLPTRDEYRVLGQFNGPVLRDKQRVSPDHERTSLNAVLQAMDIRNGWLLFTETINEQHARIVRRYAKDHGMNVAAIFYDAIPVLRPELCKDPAITQNHGDYMKGLAECGVVIPISNFSAESLKHFWDMSGIKGCPIVPNLLPGEFGGSERRSSIQLPPKGKISILCVSTLEPRKNHLRLINACLLLQKNHPDLDWSLTLVGNRYAGAFDIADAVESIAAKNLRIKWLGIVDDGALHRLYDEAAFTVYPSVIEGFGMPILESIWHGKPCICSREGVMAELADGGGCLTTDVMNEEALSESMHSLAADRDLLLSLSKQAVSRVIKTWDEYARQFISILSIHTKAVPHRLSEFPSTTREVPEMIDRTWEDILYPGCLLDNWQMNHSERLSLTALLARHKPHCSIEIGTFQGGSLSLISQYSDMVFSIDIDPSIPEKFGHFSNVSFFTGPSSVILPMLMKELDSAGIPIDFILIDGDHSAEGIKRDINIVLSYVPKKPLFVMMHDGFNPECRRGMLEADWADSRYVDWVDIDFIPGRVIEHGGGGDGEMWGGLGLAYLLPKEREGSLKVTTSAEMSYEKMKASQYR